VTDAAIELEALGKQYGTTVAVNALRFHVAAGRIVGFLGRNGAGKSTTIKMLLGMIVPTSGTARVLGHRIDDAGESLAIRRSVAYVGEDKGLYPYMTVRELIAFTRSFYPDWDPALEARLLAQYDLPASRKVKALSKGMRTKLALLLALARRPAILILDEPTEGLDPVSIEQLLRELAGRSADGTTVFFSSHQLDEVERIADDVLIIERGTLVLDAALDDVRTHFRSVIAGFPATPRETAFQMPGVRSARVDGRQISVLVTDNVDAVVRRAHELGATSVNVNAVSLREVFLERVAS
jgi:ABC-2 type transport system ATP-binding protein